MAAVKKEKSQRSCFTEGLKPLYVDNVPVWPFQLYIFFQPLPLLTIILTILPQ